MNGDSPPNGNARAKAPGQPRSTRLDRSAVEPRQPTPRPAGANGHPSKSTDTTVFALGSLGWKAFQDLCGTVLGAILGQTVTAFRPTKDSGRDFAFEGQWEPQAGEALTGRFVVQCKFKASGNFYRSDLAGELPKVRRLVRAGHCETYLLMTNAGMTASTAADLTGDLAKRGVRHSLLIGGDQLDKYIRETPRLRALVPRLYGLGDLTQILDQRRYEQAEALLASMREDISKFVITAPYRRAVEALMAHGFVFLVGAPAAGKSMIASALAAASIDMWGSRPIKSESAGAFASAWNPGEPDQLFWIDDAFGATQYQRHRTDEWNQILTNLRAAVARGAKVVMTSRDYIWEEASGDLKLGVFPPLRTEQVVVDVHDLQLDDKRQILYNHVRYGTQPQQFRTAVKPFLEAAAHVDVFLPEVARRFGDPQFTREVRPNELSVVAFFEHPVEHLEEVVSGLGRDEFAALAVLFMAKGSRESPLIPSQVESDALARLGSSVAGVLKGMTALRGSLVTLGPRPDHSPSMTWTFKHPTIGDAVQRRIAARPEHLTIYLLGSPLESILTQITCGDVGLEGALVVPESCFEIVAARLDEAARDPTRHAGIADFAVTRCSPEFLRRYRQTFESIELEATNSGSVRIASRLHRLGLLAEKVRSRLVAYWVRLAIDWLDLDVVTNPEIRGLMRPDEMEAFLDQLRTAVARDLMSYVGVAEEGFDGSESPDDVVGRLRLALDTLLEMYPDDSDVENAVDAAEGELSHLEGRLNETWQDDSSDDYGDWRDRVSMSRPADVGMFSDVDD